MGKPQNNRAKAIVDAAAANGWCVPAMCLYNLEGIIASVRAAEAKNSALIIQLFPWAVTYADGLLVHAAAEAAKKAKVPVAVHMDHCQDPAMVKRAADLGGFDGIMVDMSHFEKEENLQKTTELTEYWGSLRRLNRAESMVERTVWRDTAELEGILTTPEQADEFISTGIDWLAPAFGNVHGKYGPKGPQLQYDRLKSIRESTKGKVELVLHGAGAEYFGTDNGKLFQDNIAHGIAKANINDIVNGPYLKHLEEHAKEGMLTKLIEEATDVMQKETEKCMDWCKSSGRAGDVKFA